MSGDRILLRACVRGQSVKFRTAKGCSDNILPAIPADAASWYWNLAGDLKLFTHFPWNPPALVERVAECVFVCVKIRADLAFCEALRDSTVL